MIVVYTYLILIVEMWTVLKSATLYSWESYTLSVSIKLTQWHCTFREQHIKVQCTVNAKDAVNVP